MLINIIADIIHFLKIFLVCDMYFFFERKRFRHKWIMLTLTNTIVAGMSVFVYMYDNYFIEALIYTLTIILLLCIFYKEAIYTIVITTIWTIFALSMIDTMVAVLFDMFMKILDVNVDFLSNLAVAIISIVLIYVVGRIYRKYTSATLKKVGIPNLMGFTVLLAIDTVVVTIITVMNAKFETMRYTNIYLLAIVFVILGIFIQVASVILLFTQRNVYKEKEELTDKYLNEQTLHYEYLENRERETKKFRHDLRSHMELISHLAKSREYDKIDEYIEQMHERIDTFGNVITVHNSIVDAIINQYYTRAEQSGITMEVKGRFPLDCNIDTYDLCTIFSNVLSNALEAARETEEKYIFVECGYTDKSIIIIVKNSFDVQTKNGNAQWRTRKGNTDYHGYGLENIQDSVERYNGVFDIETDDKMFTVKILFRNRK
ncbi:MAG: GHKL domain-containing protein [Lachnospiraceae bacterium]|nr:GHKL domain-containing protein [Lachnospiraceae bacterium]